MNKKDRHKEKRLAMKRARKEANKRKYEEMRLAGQNSKKKEGKPAKVSTRKSYFTRWGHERTRVCSWPRRTARRARALAKAQKKVRLCA